MRRLRRVTRDDEGFSLLELLVAMAISTVVLLAILNSADLFTSSANRAGDASKAQESARRQLRSMVVFLRQGRIATGQTSVIPSQWTPSRTDLTAAAYVASTTEPIPGDVAGWVRYCVATNLDGDSSLIVGVRQGDTYVAPGACTVGSGPSGWIQSVAIKDRLAATTMLFNYASSTCAGATCLPAGTAVSTVGIRMATAPAHATTTLTTVLTDAVSFRNRS